MQNKPIKLIQPTVEEFIKVLQQFPPDAVVTESEIGLFIGVSFSYYHDHWDDDGYGHPVDCKFVKLSFYDPAPNW
jgi:hypothetical protein